MRRVALRDLVLVAAAVLGFHALFVSFPSILARSEPATRLLPLTAPDCVTSVVGERASGWFQGGARADAPAGPVRH